ncbi:MAG: hypothetical protein KGL73_06430 [Burkholderiales bacterium]|nr:hypothetical protein [Burkholderiales bacterium]
MLFRQAEPLLFAHTTARSNTTNENFIERVVHGSLHAARRWPDHLAGKLRCKLDPCDFGELAIGVLRPRQIPGAPGHQPGALVFGWSELKSPVTAEWMTFNGVLERPSPKFFENRPK